MAQFLLMLYDNPADWHKLSPDEMQKAIGSDRPNFAELINPQTAAIRKSGHQDLAQVACHTVRVHALDATALGDRKAR